MPRKTTRRSRIELYVTSKMLKKPGQGLYVWKRFNPVTASYDHTECGPVIATRSDPLLQVQGLVSALTTVEEGAAVTCVISHPVVFRNAQNLAALEMNGFRRHGREIANVENWHELARLVTARSVGFKLASKVGEDRRVMRDLLDQAPTALAKWLKD